MALTKAQAIDWLNQSVGKHYNPDGAYGYQCKDYADAYAIALFGNWVNTLRPNDAKYVFDGANPDFFEKIRNNPADINLIPQAGDIIVYNGWGGNPYGHIEVVLDANTAGAVVIYQDGFKQIPATKIFRPYNQLPIIGWLRPKYRSDSPAPVDNTWRKVVSGVGVNVRNEPTTKSGVFASYPQGSEIQMKGWCKGQNVEGSDIWFISARSTKFIHSSALDKGTDGLPHLAEFDKIEVNPEKKVEVQAPPAPPAPEYINFEKEFDFVDRVEAVETSNQFYGRKNLKNPDGKYIAEIPEKYDTQKTFVDSLDRPTHQIEEITIHNTANTSVNATINEFRRKNSYKSSHLIVSNTEIVQCVRKTDTAFTNGSHESNIKSFTIEFLDDVEDARYVEVLKKVSKALGVEKIGKHRDHSATACPAKLTDEKIAEIIAKIRPQSTESKKTTNNPENEQKPVENENKPNVSNGEKPQLTKQDMEKYMKEIKNIESDVKNTFNQIATDESLDELKEMIPKKVRMYLYILGELVVLAGVAIVSYEAGSRLTNSHTMGIASALASVGAGLVAIIKMTKGGKK